MNLWRSRWSWPWVLMSCHSAPKVPHCKFGRTTVPFLWDTVPFCQLGRSLCSRYSPEFASNHIADSSCSTSKCLRWKGPSKSWRRLCASTRGSDFCSYKYTRRCSDCLQPLHLFPLPVIIRSFRARFCVSRVDSRWRATLSLQPGHQRLLSSLRIGRRIGFWCFSSCIYSKSYRAKSSSHLPGAPVSLSWERSCSCSLSWAKDLCLVSRLPRHWVSELGSSTAR